MFGASREFIETVLRDFVTRPGRLVLAGMTLLLSAGALIALPIMTSAVVQSFSHAGVGGLDLLDPSLLGLATTFLVWLVSSSVNGYIQEQGNQRAVLHARLGLCRRWLARSPSSDDARFGSISRITADAQAFERALAALSHHSPLAVMQIVGALSCMLFVAPVLGAVFILCLVAVAGALSFAEKHLVELSMQVSEATDGVITRSVELLSHNRLIRRFRQERAECARVERAQEQLMQLLDLRRQRQIVARLVVFMALALSIAGIALIGLAQVRSGTAVPGDLIAFLGLSLIVGTSVTTLTDSIASISAGVEPLRRLTERFDDTSPSGVMEHRFSRGPEITVDGLHFHFSSNADGFSLQIKDLAIEAGSTVALVGGSGSGKSTLLRLIAGEENVGTGTICLDGVDVGLLTREARLAAAAYFDPAAPILARPVRENILFGRERSACALDDVARAAAADDLVDRGGDGRGFPEGLSSGQRQRIALARTLLSDAPLLLLDEATSAIDSRQEKAILDGISKAYPSATKIVVSHRLSAVKGADRIIVLSRGRIVEDGGYDELVSRNSAFKALFYDQLSSE
jgi:ATP-binding cassette, subfamily B, bacterial